MVEKNQTTSNVSFREIVFFYCRPTVKESIPGYDVAN